MAAPDFDALKKTPLFDRHRAAGARIVDFGGWAMPVKYTGVLAEHRGVREAVGLFDVSHMGEFLVEGDGAEAFLQRLTTNDVATLAVGQAQYSLALLPTGGVVDDLLVYKRSDGRYLVCVNAACIDNDWEWFTSHHDETNDACTLLNASNDWAQLAIQGRHAPALVAKLTDLPVSDITYYRFAEGTFAGVPAIVARTGYTGEDGFEVFVAPDAAPTVWDAVLAAGEEYGIQPIGLGARDTLRLEMKYSLYGNDITTETTPLEARLGWITKLKKGDFIGRDALLAQKAEGLKRVLVAFKLLERGIARHGHPVIVDGEPYGEVTSGSMSPSLGDSIGLCYLPFSHRKPGSRFEVQVRKNRIPAEVVKPPFYRRPY
jgi:aminomethyltransferase